MSMIATDIKTLLSITLKARHDNLTDQYSRVFMVKLMLVCTIIMGISWFEDKITCVVPGVNAVDADFVSSACWIQGVYVYKQLVHRVDDLAYFGIPKDINNDGMLETGELCNRVKSFGNVNEKCIPMDKIFFLQYQWLPFLIATFSVMYYIPYTLFLSINSDNLSLKRSVKGGEGARKISQHYFGRQPVRTHMIRQILQLLTKVFYILLHIVVFYSIDNLLNSLFYDYGSKWIAWTKLENSIAYDYMGKRDHPKPGNELLPPFGYCEMYESAKDIKHTIANKHKFVCELSQHILYQYCFIVMWFSIVIGIAVASLGLIIFIGQHVVLLVKRDRTSNKADKKLLKLLTTRELFYLDYIKTTNESLHSSVIQLLKNSDLSRGNQSDHLNAYKKSRKISQPQYQL